MNIKNLAATAALATTFAVAAANAADEPETTAPAEGAKPVASANLADGEKRVAFRIASGTGKGYVSAATKVGLDLKGRKITGRQIFTMRDLNGGDLAEGDSVQIRWTPTGTKPTYWIEGENGVGRKGGKPGEKSTFKVHLKAKATADAPQQLTLQTASDKFFAGTGTAVSLSEKEDDALTLELVDNPEREED